MQNIKHQKDEIRRLYIGKRRSMTPHERMAGDEAVFRAVFHRRNNGSVCFEIECSGHSAGKYDCICVFKGAKLSGRDISFNAYAV